MNDRLSVLATHGVDATGSALAGLSLPVVCGIAFVAILVVVGILLSIPFMYAERTRRNSRLAEISRYRMVGAVGQDADLEPAGPTMSEFTAKALNAVDKGLRARGRRAAVVSELEMTGIRIRPEEWAAIQMMVVLGSGVLTAFLISNIFGLLVGAGVGWGLCRMFVRFKISKRKADFETQLPDALQLLAGALRSGFALNQSIAALVREGTEPVAGEFARALSEVRLGADLEEALNGIALRMDSYDMSLVCMAIRTAREVGGNLAEVLSTTVATMRERAHLKGQVKALTAEGRVSAKVLTFMPFGIAGYMSMVNPGSLSPLFHSLIGIVMLVGGGLLMAVGVFWMNRLVNIEV